MSTQSIFTNIVINTPEEAENLIRALEEAEKLAETHPLRKVNCKMLTDEDLTPAFFESLINGINHEVQ